MVFPYRILLHMNNNVTLGFWPSSYSEIKGNLIRMFLLGQKKKWNEYYALSVDTYNHHLLFLSAP